MAEKEEGERRRKKKRIAGHNNPSCSCSTCCPPSAHRGACRTVPSAGPLPRKKKKQQERNASPECQEGRRRMRLVCCRQDFKTLAFLWSVPPLSRAEVRVQACFQAPTAGFNNAWVDGLAEIFTRRRTVEPPAAKL